MYIIKRIICCLLACLLLTNGLIINVFASEENMTDDINRLTECIETLEEELSRLGSSVPKGIDKVIGELEQKRVPPKAQRKFC